jgi:predicted nucleic acid-binding protein
MKYVIDASVAAKWYFEEENLRNQADRVLAEIVKSPRSFFVPELFYIELAGVLVRRSGFDSPFSSLAISKLQSLGIPTVSQQGNLLKQAIRFACETKLSIYDSVYLALAVELKACWLTCDNKAAAKVADLTNDDSASGELYSKHLRHLENF